MSIFDADTHLYEEPDCFTRFLPARYRPRALEVSEFEGARRWCFAGAPTVFVPDDISSAHGPGAGAEVFEPNTDPPKRHPTDIPLYRDPIVRRQFNESHAVIGAAVLPNIGLVAEHEMRSDPEASVANIVAYNTWLGNAWGFNLSETLFAIPIIPTAIPEATNNEIHRLVSLGVRAVVVRPGPWGGLPPGDAAFDPFWSTVASARIPVYVHITQSGYSTWFGPALGIEADPADTALTPLHVLGCFGSRPMEDTFTSLAMWGVFDRWPDVIIVSAENGGDFVDRLWDLEPFFGQWRSDRMSDASGRSVAKPEKSIRTLARRHLRVVSPPYRSAAHLVSRLGAEAVLFGSDFPHPEGLPTPGHSHFVTEGLDMVERAKVLCGNASRLFGLADVRG